jgi:hypothetical protein
MISDRLFHRELSPHSSTDIYILSGNEAGCSLYAIPPSDGKLTLGAKFVATKPRPQNNNKTKLISLRLCFGGSYRDDVRKVEHIGIQLSWSDRGP